MYSIEFNSIHLFNYKGQDADYYSFISIWKYFYTKN